MIGIISIGISNIASVQNALNKLGHHSFLIKGYEDIKNASCIIFPGVGNFTEAMIRVRERKIDIGLKEAEKAKIPILGICLGMHLLADEGSEGSEGGSTKGIGLIPGKVSKINTNTLKLPHIGWNSLNKIITHESTILNKFKDIDFYFLHSFKFNVKNKYNLLATVRYEEELAAIIQKDLVYGFQFHPEKSQRAGLELLNRFIINVKK